MLVLVACVTTITTSYYEPTQSKLWIGTKAIYLALYNIANGVTRIVAKITTVSQQFMTFVSIETQGKI